MTGRPRRPWATAAGLALLLAAAPIAAAETQAPLPTRDWSFSGPFGSFDQAALRRGLNVYLDACAGCHSLRHVAYRNLTALGIGFGPENIKAFAEEFELVDGPDDAGKMFTRPARPADRFVSPYPNAGAARAANNGMVPPDLSLITKARADGVNHLYAFLIGYGEAPDGVVLGPGMYYNVHAPGGQTGMPPSLFPDMVEYEDGTEATVEQMAADVTTFLAWAAEPHMEARKSLGWRVVVFLALLTVLFIALKHEVWAHLTTPRQPPQRSET